MEISILVIQRVRAKISLGVKGLVDTMLHTDITKPEIFGWHDTV